MLGWAAGCLEWRLAGMVPLRLVRPMVGRSPTQAQWDAGPRVLSPVSVPSDACANPAATAAALPPLDPAEQVPCAVGYVASRCSSAKGCSAHLAPSCLNTCYGPGVVVGIPHDAKQRPP